MAKVIVPRGPLGLSAQRPVERESRVVSMFKSLPVPANLQFCFTEVLAQRLMLLAIDVWVFGKPSGPNDSWWFSVRRGFSLPTDIAQVWQWEDVLPFQTPVGRGWPHGYSTPYHMHWDMRKLFEGQAQRFAAAINIVGPIVSYFEASLHIAEG